MIICQNIKAEDFVANLNMEDMDEMLRAIHQRKTNVRKYAHKHPPIITESIYAYVNRMRMCDTANNLKFFKMVYDEYHQQKGM